MRQCTYMKAESQTDYKKELTIMLMLITLRHILTTDFLSLVFSELSKVLSQYSFG